MTKEFKTLSDDILTTMIFESDDEQWLSVPDVKEFIKVMDKWGKERRKILKEKYPNDLDAIGIREGIRQTIAQMYFLAGDKLI